MLKLIRAKTKIQARSDEEKKTEPRGRPLFDLAKAKEQTEANEKKREEKYPSKEIPNEFKADAKKATNVIAASKSRQKKKEVQTFCQDTLTQIKKFC